MSKQCVGCTGVKRAMLYNTTTQEYIKQRSVQVAKLCNGFSVKNAGTTIVTLNGEPLQPGEAKTVGGNENEVYVGRIDLNFVVQSPAPTPVTNSAWVTQKFFEESNFV